jgi:tetracycline repressor-like protein
MRCPPYSGTSRMSNDQDRRRRDEQQAASRRGPREDRGVLAERILAHARASFAERGWAGTSMRAVARDADVDPRLVTYYFGTKGDLLEACLVPPPGSLEGVAAVAASPIAGRGEALARFMMGSWEHPERAAVSRSIILTLRVVRRRGAAACRRTRRRSRTHAELAGATSPPYTFGGVRWRGRAGRRRRLRPSEARRPAARGSRSLGARSPRPPA